jgi:hypothetical protein
MTELLPRQGGIAVQRADTPVYYGHIPGVMIASPANAKRVPLTWSDFT